MKLLISFILFIFVFGCAQSNQVYWCGDHECINKKEKQEYFKKTMTVEVRSLDKSNKKELSELEIIKSRTGLYKNEIIKTPT